MHERISVYGATALVLNKQQNSYCNSQLSIVNFVLLLTLSCVSNNHGTEVLHCYQANSLETIHK